MLGAVLEGVPDPVEGQEEWVTPDGESVADVREGYAELEKPEPLGRRRRSWPGVGSPKHCLARGSGTFGGSRQESRGHFVWFHLRV